MPQTEQSCRKCGGNELYSKDVYARGPQGPDLLPVGGGLFNSPKFHIQVCGGCGLVEWFVPPEFLDMVKDKFTQEG